MCVCVCVWGGGEYRITITTMLTVVAVRCAREEGCVRASLCAVDDSHKPCSESCVTYNYRHNCSHLRLRIR